MRRHAGPEPDLGPAKELGFHVFTLAENRKEPGVALPLNAGVVSSADILTAARSGVIEDSLF